MTKSSLNADECRTAEIIEALGFGVIGGLVIRGGSPCYEREPRLVQTIKLDLEPERQTERGCADLTLKREFESLFHRLHDLGDAIVDIEIRHGLPFKLVVERRRAELP